jgi:hypothetical protein
MSVVSKLAAAQEALAPLFKRDSKNPHFKNEYMSLEKMLQVTNRVLKDHGLFLTQPVDIQSGQNVVSSIIQEIEWREDEDDERRMVVSRMVLPALNDVQKLGGAITYARRYTLAALLGLSPDKDDDGNIAAAGDLLAKLRK